MPCPSSGCDDDHVDVGREDRKIEEHESEGSRMHRTRAKSKPTPPSTTREPLDNHEDERRGEVRRERCSRNRPEEDGSPKSRWRP